MILREEKQGYDSAAHMAETIKRTRPAYDALVARLGKLGTEVARDRVLETDDIAPYDFVRKGTVEFIFPPQPDAEPMSNERGPISETQGQLVAEKAMRCFDKSLVEAHIAIDYDDANNWAAMRVTDVHGESAVPAEVSAALEEAFAVYEPVEQSRKTRATYLA